MTKRDAKVLPKQASPGGDGVAGLAQKQLITLGFPELYPMQHLAEMLASAADVSLFVDQAGIIRAVLPSPQFKRQTSVEGWVGNPIGRHLTTESQGKWRDRLDALARGDTEWGRPVELNQIDGDNSELPVR